MSFLTKRVGLAVAILGVLVGSVREAKADIAVSLTPDPGNTFNNSNGYSLGFEFHTNQAISVAALGYFDSGSGLSESHHVGIYDSGGSLLGSTTVTGSSPLIDNFRYHNLSSSINLAAGTDYFIAGNSGFTDPYTFLPIAFSTSPSITFVSSAFTSGNALAFPSTDGSIGYFGPNFSTTQVAAVPEPATLVSAGLAAAFGLIQVRRRRKAKAA